MYELIAYNMSNLLEVNSLFKNEAVAYLDLFIYFLNR